MELIGAIAIVGAIFLGIVTALVVIGASGADAHIDRKAPDPAPDKLAQTLISLQPRR